MSKIGLTIAAGLVLTTGLWGMTHSAAIQDAVGGGDVTAAGGDGATQDTEAVELTGKTDVIAENDPLEGIEVAATGASMPTTDVTLNTQATKHFRPLSGAEVEFSRQTERNAERELNEFMQTRLTRNLNFKESPLPEILQELSRCMNESQQRTTLLIPDRRALEADSVVLADIMITDIEIPDGLMTFGGALSHILSQSIETELTWIAKDGLVLITTKAAAESEKNMILRSYDISGLRKLTWRPEFKPNFNGGPQGGGGFGGGGGGYFSLAPGQQRTGHSSTNAEVHETETPSSDTVDTKTTTKSSSSGPMLSWEDRLMETILNFTQSTCRWYKNDGEGGHLNIAGNRLIVRQSRSGHEQVVAVLEQLELAVQDMDEEE